MPKEKRKILQEFEGEIGEVSEDSFSAILKGITNPNYFDELGRIWKKDISKENWSDIEPGRIFFLRMIEENGQVKSEFEFVYFEKWTREEIEAAKKETKK